MQNWNPSLQKRAVNQLCNVCNITLFWSQFGGTAMVNRDGRPPPIPLPPPPLSSLPQRQMSDRPSPVSLLPSIKNDFTDTLLLFYPLVKYVNLAFISFSVHDYVELISYVNTEE